MQKFTEMERKLFPSSVREIEKVLNLNCTADLDRVIQSQSSLRALSSTFQLPNLVGNLKSAQKALDQLNSLPLTIQQAFSEEANSLLSRLLKEIEIPLEEITTGECLSVDLQEELCVTDHAEFLQVTNEAKEWGKLLPSWTNLSHWKQLYEKSPILALVFLYWIFSTAGPAYFSWADHFSRERGQEIQPFISIQIENSFNTQQVPLSDRKYTAGVSQFAHQQLNSDDLIALKHMGIVTTKQSALNIRRSPKRKGAILGTLPRRAVVTILEEGFYDHSGRINRDWWRVSYAPSPETSHIEGWVYARYITRIPQQQ